jgi:hypothetical protein
VTAAELAAMKELEDMLDDMYGAEAVGPLTADDLEWAADAATDKALDIYSVPNMPVDAFWRARALRFAHAAKDLP